MRLPRISSDRASGPPQLLAKPYVRRLVGESRMPRHEIGKTFDLVRRFRHTYISDRRDDLRQSSRQRENQIGTSDSKDRRPEKREVEPGAPFQAQLRQWSSSRCAARGVQALSEALMETEVCAPLFTPADTKVSTIFLVAYLVRLPTAGLLDSPNAPHVEGRVH
jgi:hypothetical protein